MTLHIVITTIFTISFIEFLLLCYHFYFIFIHLYTVYEDRNILIPYLINLFHLSIPDKRHFPINMVRFYLYFFIYLKSGQLF